jgi:hypothetical protein
MSIFRHINVAFDGSDRAQDALTELAEDEHADLVVVSEPTPEPAAVEA